MSERKKIKKVIVVATIIIVAIVVMAVIAMGFFFYYIRSTRTYCRNYAYEQFGTSDELHRERDGVYEQCLEDRGLEGFW